MVVRAGGVVDMGRLPLPHCRQASIQPRTVKPLTRPNLSIFFPSTELKHNSSGRAVREKSLLWVGWPIANFRVERTERGIMIHDQRSIN